MSLSVRLSVLMRHFGYHWTGFNEIRYLGIFRKFVDAILIIIKR